MRRVGAIDAGGTKVLCGIIAEDGTCLAMRRKSVPTADIPAYFRTCAAMLASAANELGMEMPALSGIGMNIPGMVLPDGHVLGSPSAGWGAFEARPLLTAALAGVAPEKLFFENDINACALAEKRFGNAPDNFIWMTISTGNGGAVVANGKLVRGRNGCAGEFGHLIVEREHPYACTCGHQGCLEAHASGVALARRAAAFGLDVDARQLETLARGGDRTALCLYEETGVYIGRALAIAANLLNPDVAYLGGGVAKALDLMLPAIRRTFQAETVGPNAALRIERTHLGYEAALLGAAVVALEKSKAFVKIFQ